jgi:NAD(P)-dependent dehydrogenase (short-subunit alcohol dehydrogenase family)
MTDSLSKAQAAQAKGDTKGALEAAREALKTFHAEGNVKGVADAKEICALCRPKTVKKVDEVLNTPWFPVSKQNATCVPGITGPTTVKAQNVVNCFRIAGSCELKRLSGMVCCVTGASRGIGKGLSEMLAQDGAIVYVTGRSSPGKVTDILLMGTVDETAASFAKLGGAGIAVHVDHAQDSQNKALTSLIETNHGRCDVLVNNAFYIPKPDLVFFNTPLWMQPIRFLNEQIAVGGFNHAAQTLLFLSALRRGKGIVINISSWGSQLNIGIFPVSYLCNKAAFDKTLHAMSERMRNYNVHVMTLWPGSVKSERSIMGAKRSGAKLIDLESVRFTGQAVVGIAVQPAEMLSRWSGYHRVLSCADVATFEMDGYMHCGDIHTFASGGRTKFKDLP